MKIEIGLHSLRAGGAINAVTLVFQIDYSKNMGDGKLIKPKMDMLGKI
jgi:hypothetical protein